MSDNILVTGRWGETHVTSAQAGNYNSGIVGAGCYVMSGLDATMTNANTCHISPGFGSFNGRDFEVPAGGIDLTIDNGTQAQCRNDLVVVRYALEPSSQTESAELVVVKGTPAASEPADPAVNEGSILDGDSPVDMPLWRIPLDGITVGDPVRLFHTVVPLADASSAANQALSKANSLESLFELVKFGQVTQTLMTPSSNGFTIGNSLISYALNQDGTYGKVYGRIQVTTQTGDSGQRVILKAGSIPFKKPSSTVKVSFVGITSCSRVGQNDIERIGVADIWLEPDGSCSFSCMSTPWTDEEVKIDILAIPIYFKDFGDAGVEELTSLINAPEEKFLEAVRSV